VFVFATDKVRLWKHFQKDRALFAYHIGDLDDFFFPQCQWAASYSTKRHPIVEEVVLIYHGGQPPTVLAFGVGPSFSELLGETFDILPSRFFCHFQTDCGDLLRSRYCEQPLGAHYKMCLQKLEAAPLSGDGTITGLDQSHLSAVENLYARAYPGNYFVPRMLDTGRYFGIEFEGRLVAVAGVHVVSDEYKIAVLGNIATDPNFRGRGLARRVSYHLTRILHNEGKLVCLNVKADNDAAIRCYQQIGFSTTHSYNEAVYESASNNR
jgi:GNAT superfamily N-acetyltransferase